MSYRWMETFAISLFANLLCLQLQKKTKNENKTKTISFIYTAKNYRKKLFETALDATSAFCEHV